MIHVCTSLRGYDVVHEDLLPILCISTVIRGRTVGLRR